jgi:hypothetical protein
MSTSFTVSIQVDEACLTSALDGWMGLRDMEVRVKEVADTQDIPELEDTVS